MIARVAKGLSVHSETTCQDALLYSTWCTGLSIQLQDVSLVAATEIGAPGVGACVLAQLVAVEFTLINIFLLLYRVGSFISGTDGEGFLGELTFGYWKE